MRPCHSLCAWANWARVQWILVVLQYASAFSVHTKLGRRLWSYGDLQTMQRSRIPLLHACDSALTVIQEQASRKWIPVRPISTSLASFPLAEEGEGRFTGMESKGGTFVLPVFPLRKAIKMPSETLTLNLYEPRYLELAEWVLSDGGIFGALYSSDKPQMIKDGVGPIVPMVEPGDIGVVCTVIYNEEGMVPTSASGKDNDLRRRIKLKGFAVGRFRIEKVLHNGFGGGAVPEASDVEPLPFILVEASRVDDEPEEEKRIVDIERELYASMLEGGGIVNDILKRIGGGEGEDGDESYVSAQRLAQLLPSELADSDSAQMVDATGTNQTKEEVMIENALYVWECGASKGDLGECSGDDLRRQLFSFALASALVPDKPVAGMMKLLESVSTSGRLEYILQAKEGRSWFSINKSLHDMS